MSRMLDGFVKCRINDFMVDSSQNLESMLDCNTTIINMNDVIYEKKKNMCI